VQKGERLYSIVTFSLVILRLAFIGLSSHHKRMNKDTHSNYLMNC